MLIFCIIVKSFISWFVTLSWLIYNNSVKRRLYGSDVNLLINCVYLYDIFSLAFLQLLEITDCELVDENKFIQTQWNDNDKWWIYVSIINYNFLFFSFLFFFSFFFFFWETTIIFTSNKLWKKTNKTCYILIILLII